MNDTKPLRETVEKFVALTALPNINELRPHAIAEQDPEMNAAEFEALKVSIKGGETASRGQQSPKQLPCSISGASA